MTKLTGLDQKVPASKDKFFTLTEVNAEGKEEKIEPTIKDVLNRAIYNYKDLKGDIKSLRRQMKLADAFDYLEENTIELSNENAIMLREMMLQATHILSYGRPPIMSSVLISRAMVLCGLDDEPEDTKVEQQAK